MCELLADVGACIRDDEDLPGSPHGVNDKHDAFVGFREGRRVSIASRCTQRVDDLGQARQQVRRHDAGAADLRRALFAGWPMPLAMAWRGRVSAAGIPLIRISAPFPFAEP